MPWAATELTRVNIIPGQLRVHGHFLAPTLGSFDVDEQGSHEHVLKR